MTIHNISETKVDDIDLNLNMTRYSYIRRDNGYLKQTSWNSLVRFGQGLVK